MEPPDERIVEQYLEAEQERNDNAFLGTVADAQRALDDLKAQLRQVTHTNARLREALDKLARLGNEPYYGNSTGNVIAQRALAATDVKENT